MSEMNEVLFVHDKKNIQMKFGCAILFFDYGLQFTKSKKHVEELFSAVECFTKLFTAFGSAIFILCCDCLFHWFDDLIEQEFVNCVDEIDDFQRVICINDLLTMSEPPPTRCERFSSDVIYFDEICDNCKKH